MPRPTASIRGSVLQPPTPRTPSPQPSWYKLPLSMCSLWAHDNSLVLTWTKTSNPADPVLTLLLGMQKEKPGIFTLCVKNQQDQIIMLENVPLMRGELEIRFFPETYSFDLKVYRNGTNTLMVRWTFALHIEGSADTAPVRGVWDQLRKCVQQIPAVQLRYVNIPRSLREAERAASRYNIQHLPAHALPARARGGHVDLHLPNLGILMTSTGVIASANFQALLEYLRTGRSVPRASTPPSPPLALLPADANNPIAVAEQLRQGRKAMAVLATVCGYCYEGTVPITTGSISRRRHRKEWIGCENGLDCPQDNFWYHLTSECAGISAAQAPTKCVWWCRTCRVDRPAANEFGLEPRSRL